MWAACSAWSPFSCSAGWSPAWSWGTAETRRCSLSAEKVRWTGWSLNGQGNQIAHKGAHKIWSQWTRTHLEEESSDHISVGLRHDPQLGLRARQLALVVHSPSLPIPGQPTCSLVQIIRNTREWNWKSGFVTSLQLPQLLQNRLLLFSPLLMQFVPAISNAVSNCNIVISVGLLWWKL